MPYLELITNVSDELITKEFQKSLGDAVAKTLDRPREKVLLYIEAGKRITMGVNDEPCACVKLLSIGRLGVEENIKHSLAIANELEKIGIAPDKAFIYFEESQPYQVGNSKTTYEEIFKQIA